MVLWNDNNIIVSKGLLKGQLTFWTICHERGEWYNMSNIATIKDNDNYNLPQIYSETIATKIQTKYKNKLSIKLCW